MHSETDYAVVNDPVNSVDILGHDFYQDGVEVKASGHFKVPGVFAPMAHVKVATDAKSVDFVSATFQYQGESCFATAHMVLAGSPPLVTLDYTIFRVSDNAAIATKSVYIRNCRTAAAFRSTIATYRSFSCCQ